MRVIGIILLIMSMQAGAAVRTFYIDYTTGSDGNNGTSQGTPWKHCPAMGPFSGAYTPQAGDRFIFKGGVTWPNAALPLQITVGGEPGKETYYGVDQAWFAGAEWTRPIFDAEGSAFVNHGGNRGNMIWVKSSGGSADNLIIDGLEMKGWIWTDPISTSESDGCSVYVDSTDDVLIQNCYVHDWVVMTTQDSKFGGFIADNDSTSLTLSNCIVKAPTYIDPQYCTDATGRTSGCGVRGFDIIDGCEFIGTTQGMWSAEIVRNCIVRDGQDSYNSPTHENGTWQQNNTVFYNNLIYNAKEGVGAYFLPGYGSRSNRKLYVWNNVFYNTAQINLSNQDSPDTSNELWFFNNVVKQAATCIRIGTGKGGAAFGRLIVQNNLFISTSGDTPSALVVIEDASDLGAQYTNSHNVYMTTAAAAALGMTTENLFTPTNAVPALVNTGYDFSSLMAYDRLGTYRPQDQTWDIGAYEWYEGETPEEPEAPLQPRRGRATRALFNRMILK